MIAGGYGQCVPVAEARLAIAGDNIVGHAAPTHGPLPCVLRLEADGVPIAITRATRFAAAAAAAGIRQGWCGVVLPGLSSAAALADTVQVRCHASNRLLFDAAVPLPSPPPDRAPPMTVAELLVHVRSRDACGDVERILPFAFATLRGGGIGCLLDAAYRTLLQRAAEPALLAAWAAAPPPDPVRASLRMILTSDEYLGDPERVIPGPFHPAFAFDLSPLDDRVQEAGGAGEVRCCR